MLLCADPSSYLPPTLEATPSFRGEIQISAFSLGPFDPTLETRVFGALAPQLDASMFQVEERLKDSDMLPERLRPKILAAWPHRVCLFCLLFFR